MADPVVIFLTSGTSWQVPNDWNDDDNTIECIGAGSGGGGGGGAYSKKINLALTKGATVNYAVGAGGSSGQIGGDTWFNGSSAGNASVLAKGGQSVAEPDTPSPGGSASEGVGDVKYSGGAGYSASLSTFTGGGGGGAAGPDGDGGNGHPSGGGGGGNGGASATGGTGASGNNGGGNGGSVGNPGSAGGDGSVWTQTSDSGTAGPGGGGGGGSENALGMGRDGGNGGLYGGGGGGASGGKGGDGTGGSGGQGIIVITYTPVEGANVAVKMMHYRRLRV